jgi:hypothetical protein
MVVGEDLSQQILSAGGGTNISIRQGPHLEDRDMYDRRRTHRFFMIGAQNTTSRDNFSLANPLESCHSESPEANEIAEPDPHIPMLSGFNLVAEIDGVWQQSTFQNNFDSRRSLCQE